MYFKTATVADEVFSLVYGPGIITFVAPQQCWIPGFYVIQVKFDDGHTAHYTENGIPNWCTDRCIQTLFYSYDIDITKLESGMHPTTKVPSIQKVTKWISEGNCEYHCPSGLWRNVMESPQHLVKKSLKKNNLHRFRKAQWDGIDRRTA